MKRIALLFVFVGLFSVLAGATIMYPPVKYGQQVTIYFSLYDSNSPWRIYETNALPADMNIVKDGGAAATPTNTMTDHDLYMSLVLSATEMQASQVVLTFKDASAPPVYMAETIIVPTFGHASALQAFDFDDATPTVDVNAWSLDPVTIATIFSDAIAEANITAAVPTASEIADKIWADEANSAVLSSLSSGQTSIATDINGVEVKIDAMAGVSTTSILSTTAASATSTTVFVLTAGLSGDDEYNNMLILVKDVSGDNLFEPAIVKDYVGSTKTITLKKPLSFTPAASDPVVVYSYQKNGGIVSPME